MIEHSDLLALAEQTAFPSVTLFLPTHRTGAELRQGPIRLKNMLREAAQALEARGMSSHEIEALFADVRKHTHSETDPFWQHRDHGLAVFISPAGTRYMDAPIHFEERIKVGRRFLVKPLLPLLMRDSRFYILAASLDTVQLYLATRFSMTPIGDERLSITALSVGAQDVLEQETSEQKTNPDTGSKTDEMMAGETPDDNTKFAQAVAKATAGMLANATEPLVLAADDRLLGRLRNHVHYRGLVEDGIREHPRSLSEDELHEKAYELVRPQLDATRADAVARYDARQGDAGKGAAGRIEDVVTAAAQGRIEALIVSIDATAAGVFLPEENRAVVAREATDDTMDLIDYAVLQTLQNGGSVYSQPADRRENLPPVAAILRF
jgi:protein required for attachment to host cells